MINGVQPALAGLDMNMPGFVAYVRLSPLYVYVSVSTFHFIPLDLRLSPRHPSPFFRETSRIVTSLTLPQGQGPQNDPNPVTATNSYWGAALIGW
jgi:hypothetical protein